MRMIDEHALSIDREGVLLQRAMNFRSVAIFPWLLIPALFVIVTVMAFNFIGNGRRDAADPDKR